MELKELQKIPNMNTILTHQFIQNYPLDLFIKKQLIQESLSEIKTNFFAQKLTTINPEDIFHLIELKFLNYQNQLRKVINGTGTILHTNLGRAPLPTASLQNILSVSGYSNLEFDLQNHKRGNRNSHLTKTFQEITGCEDACIVNNNASAVYLVLNTFCQKKKVLVARGENVEIGGSFRIPNIIKASGAKIVDVGTTNKTYLADYQEAIDEKTGAILKIHSSNYEIVGFTAHPSLAELSQLKSEKVLLIEDQGSGTLIDFKKYHPQLEGQTVQEALKEVDLLTFSGDKLLGSIQCGVILGKKTLIEKIRKNQLFRMFRVDKTVLAALEATLNLYQDEQTAIQEIPVLKMITENPEEVKKRCLKIKKQVLNPFLHLEITPTQALIGGGSLPNKTIPSYGLKIQVRKTQKEKIKEHLQNYLIPIVLREKESDLILDLKAIGENDREIIVRCLNEFQEH